MKFKHNFNSHVVIYIFIISSQTLVRLESLFGRFRVHYFLQALFRVRNGEEMLELSGV